MHILILGGTNFVGRHLVEAALTRGHQVSIFHRGQTNPGLFPQVEELTGDRDSHLEALQGRTWDAAIDVSGYVPRIVRASAELLQHAVKQYLFISTGSVYHFEEMQPFSDEGASLETLADETTEEYRGPAYGGLKVICERIVRKVYPGRELILRLGVVAGPHDPTDRITYWVDRVAQGGEVFVPVEPERRIQYIDARDLARFAIAGLEKTLTGTYNVPGNSIFWSNFLDACWQAAERPQVTFTWVDDYNFFKKISPDEEDPLSRFPMAVPPELAHLWTMTSDRALREGMLYRSALNTARDILQWERSRPTDYAWKTGVTRNEERHLLEAWHAYRTRRPER